MKEVLIIGTEPSAMLNFRKDLLQCFINSDFSVTSITNALNENELKEFLELGVLTEKVSFSRNGLNPFLDIKVFIQLFKKLKLSDPSIILAYSIKPIIWGGLAARILKYDFYALITGLGFAFQNESFNRKLLKKLVVFLYKSALRNSKAVIFQNNDNLITFIENGIVPKSKAYVVGGSGVDLKKYKVTRLPDTYIRFLCISRLLYEKGLREYAAAAKIVKDRFPNVKFDLVGPEDSSPDAISLEEVSTWSDYVKYNGPTSDVRPYIEESHVYVLPSYHEGLPRSTLEAMSMGRPILTTSAVGCKETVEEGVNGFMVPVGSSIKLAEKMIWYIENKDKIQNMGKESRRIVEKKFNVHDINKEMLRILGVE